MVYFAYSPNALFEEFEKFEEARDAVLEFVRTQVEKNDEAYVLEVNSEDRVEDEWMLMDNGQLEKSDHWVGDSIELL